jgi:hypothetical protein
MSTKADEMVERAASRLDELSQQAAASNGVKAKLAPELADDAEFLRKMKPSLVKERIKGNQPVEPAGGAGRPGAPSPQPQAQAKPKPKPRKPKRSGGGGGPSPILVLAAAFAIGYVLAKTLDWRGHAHPRD